MEFDGQEYDFVFSIDVADDTPPLPLPYNRDSVFARLIAEMKARTRIRETDLSRLHAFTGDPRSVASTFVQTHALPDSYVERIVDFIHAHTRP